MKITEPKPTRWEVVLYVQVDASNADEAGERAIEIMHQDCSWEHIGGARELFDGE